MDFYHILHINEWKEERIQRSFIVEAAPAKKKAIKEIYPYIHLSVSKNITICKQNELFDVLSRNKIETHTHTHKNFTLYLYSQWHRSGDAVVSSMICTMGFFLIIMWLMLNTPIISTTLNA